MAVHAANFFRWLMCVSGELAVIRWEPENWVRVGLIVDFDHPFLGMWSLICPTSFEEKRPTLSETSSAMPLRPRVVYRNELPASTGRTLAAPAVRDFLFLKDEGSAPHRGQSQTRRGYRQPLR